MPPYLTVKGLKRQVTSTKASSRFIKKGKHQFRRPRLTTTSSTSSHEYPGYGAPSAVEKVILSQQTSKLLHQIDALTQPAFIDRACSMFSVAKSPSNLDISNCMDYYST
jgi:hypothetical protein